jgi:hypothetical protein
MKKLKTVLGKVVKTWSAKRGIIVTRYDSRDRQMLLQRVQSIAGQGRLLQSHADGCQLINALRATAHLEGDIAEVGTAGGGSARLISEYSGDKPIHVFDTFEGLPNPGIVDHSGFTEGQYRWSMGEVQEYLSGRRIEFHKGLFPASAISVQDHRFSFVHLDVDLYQSTLHCLKFFYPRMCSGGIIITHDYSWAAGVDQAFSEFFADKLEKPIELIGDQALVVRLC